MQIPEKRKKETKKRKQTQLYLVWRQLRKNRTAMIGAAILCLIILSAILAPSIAPYHYAEANYGDALQGPSMKHIMGTDNLGRDLFSRLLYGGRTSLVIGFAATGLGAALGIAIGILAGYFGGIVDTILMRFLDIYTSIPQLVLAIALSAALGVGVGNSILAIGISSIGMYARMTRIQFMSIKEQEYIEAARATNTSTAKIIFQYILPNAIAPLIVTVTMSIGAGIMQAATLSFMGLGAQPPTPEWGAILSEARKFMRGNPHLIWFPGLFIMLSSLSSNLLGDGLRDALDPRLKD